MSFERDIFISYAHLDGLEVDEVKWVNKFHDALQTYVTKKLGKSPDIWRDVQRLKGNPDYDR